METEARSSVSIETGQDLIVAFQRGVELGRFIFDQHEVVNTTEKGIVDELIEGGLHGDVDFDGFGYSPLANNSLKAHLEKARLRVAQTALKDLSSNVSEQINGRKIKVSRVSKDDKPIHSLSPNMQNGRYYPDEGMLGLTGYPPLTSRIHPPKVKGSILPTEDVSSNVLIVKPRVLTPHNVIRDRWQVEVIGEDGQPMVDIDFMD